MNARAPGLPLECRRASLTGGRKPSSAAAGERRGAGEPELDRRSAPSHPRVLSVHEAMLQEPGVV
jgi:hypothetical protein